MAAQKTRRADGQRYESHGLIFDLLRDSERTTRTELAARSGLSKATVSEVTAGLLARGFIREVGKLQPGRGRSQVLLEFDPTVRLVLGAQFSDTACTVVLTDLRARPLHRATRPLTGTDPERFIEALCACVEELQAQAEAPILGLGVGVPGSVDPGGRTVTLSVPYDWKDVPIADLLEARLGVSALVANRAKVAALGELWQGEHAGIDDLVYAFVGGGIVAGIIVNGSLYFGSAGGAGELGHVTVLPDGTVCGCGNRGCLHTLASESAILRAVRTKARELDQSTPLAELSGNQLGRITLDLLLQAAARGDAIVLEAITEAGTYLGLALANLVNLLNPQRIVIGGPVALFGDVLLDAIRREVRRRALWDALAGLTIVSSALGEEAGPIGGAALFLERGETMADLLGPEPVARTIVPT